MRLVLMGVVSVLLVSLGVRLLRASRLAGAKPELLLGLGFVLAGVSAWLIPLAASEGMPEATAKGIAFAAQTGMSVAVALLSRFAWLVFRPDSVAARWLAFSLIAANLAVPLALAGQGAPVPTGALGVAVPLSRCSVLLWLFVESVSYSRQMRRRVSLGLAEPMVANRFTLWAIWTGALAFIPLFTLSMRALGILVGPATGVLVPVLGGGLAVALVACWLAFFPTAGYRRWIERRAAAAA